MERLSPLIKYLFLFILAIFIHSCKNKDSELEAALQFAGNNRRELEKVLLHYENEPLKLEAARFLIKNMPIHFSYKIPHHDKWETLKAKSVRDNHFTKEDSLEAFIYARQSDLTEKIFDSHVITSEYIINNIDFSFKIWRHREWNKHYSFEEFCESILPYRISNEPLQAWKEAYYNEFSPVLDSLYKGTDMLECCNALVRHITKHGFPNNYKIPAEPPVYDALFLLKNKVGGCKESTAFFAYMMRALGIPVNIDILFYADKLSQAHYWNSIRDKTGATIPFWLEKDIEDVHIKKGNNDDDIRPKWKIYRQTYSIKEKNELNLNGHFLSKILDNPILKDITADYYGKSTLILKPNIVEGQVFLTRHFLLPVDAANVEKGVAEFYNIGPDMIYSLYYDYQNKLHAVSFPFHFDGKSVRYFIPDESRIQLIKITRKTKLPQRIIKHLDNAIGLKIQDIKMPTSSTGNDLFEITDTIRTNYNNYTIKPSRRIRYIRCTAPKDCHLEIAELLFFQDLQMKDTISYRVLDEKPILSDKMHDNDPLSFYRSIEKNKSIIIDLQKEYDVKKLQFIPRNDDNFIRIGDEYELFYHIDKDWGWKSLGKKKAETNALYYKAPYNALLWLRNLTRGYEEQLFIYENEKQVFFR